MSRTAVPVNVNVARLPGSTARCAFDALWTAARLVNQLPPTIEYTTEGCVSSYRVTPGVPRGVGVDVAVGVAVGVGVGVAVGADVPVVTSKASIQMPLPPEAGLRVPVTSTDSVCVPNARPVTACITDWACCGVR